MQRYVFCILPVALQFVIGCSTESTREKSLTAIKKMGGGFREYGDPPRMSIRFTDTKVTDAGLVHLKGLTSLTELNLHGTQVSDVGLVNLKGLTNLTVLNLSDTNVTDAGLEHLKGLTRLVLLFLHDTEISDAGLVHLQGTRLKGLGLIGTKVTNAGVEKLQLELIPMCFISL